MVKKKKLCWGFGFVGGKKIQIIKRNEIEFDKAKMDGMKIS
jgi:hypothetical protein